MLSFSGLKYAPVHEQNTCVCNACVCVCVCDTFYLALLALSADLSQALECECEKHALAVSLSSASQPGAHTYTHTLIDTHMLKMQRMYTHSVVIHTYMQSVYTRTHIFLAAAHVCAG